jgi:hypothetical protein
MKDFKKIMTIYVLLNSPTLYAESLKECMKYWNEPAVHINLLEDVQCTDIWEENFQKENKILVKKIGLDLKDKNWMSTGTCNHVNYKNKDYYIYWVYLKNNRTDLIIIYDNKNSFAYSREINRKEIENGFGLEDEINVNLSCGKVGDDKKIISVLNGYIYQETSINNISKYKIYDRFK